LTKKTFNTIIKTSTRKDIILLILTEKPNVAKSFAAALNIPGNNSGYYDSPDITITNCRGHLYELFMPEDYDPKYKEWSFDNLPIIPSLYSYKKIPDAASQANLVTRLLQLHKNDKIVIATDADREGEVIARIVMSEAGIKDTSNCWRFWISATLTKDSIKKALNEMKPWKEYEGLAEKGLARQHADWLVGMNFSPYITLLSGGKATFPVGRVQTALLAAVAQRNTEVKNFVATPYYECVANLSDKDGNKATALLVNPETGKTSFNILNHHINSAHIFSLSNRSITIESTIERKKASAPHLLNLTDLSIIAAKEYDLSASQVEKLAEKLYDEYKCLSYPRTPSTVMGENEEDVKTFKQKFDMLKNDFEISKYCDESLIDISNKNLFDDKKLEGHYALIPFAKLPSNALENERKIFNIVAEYFFMSCMPPCIYDEKKLSIHNGEFIYKATIKTIVEPGWKAAYKNNDKQDQDNEIKTFDEKNCNLDSTEILKKLTTPKKEFTGESLMKFMKNPTSEENQGKLVGLGTEATRGAIIQKLQDHQYMVKEKKNFYVTSKGFFLLKQLFKNELAKKIAGIGQTTEWEKKLETSPKEFETEMQDFVISCMKIRPEVQNFEKDSIGACPLCGRKVFESKLNFFCSGYKEKPECNFSIWKEICSAKISSSDAMLLLSGKATGKKKMKSKSGKIFSAKLKLNKDSGKVEFIFDKKRG